MPRRGGRPVFGNHTLSPGLSRRWAALAAADAVEALMEKVGHPMRLRDVGVPEDDLMRCSLHAIADSNVLFNARPVTDPAEVYNLYTQAY
jgi:aldehyde dehydrogenase (NAD+)